MADRPPLQPSAASPREETLDKVLFSPLAGEMPQAEGGLPISRPIWSLPEDPPLSLRDISPRNGGERGIVSVAKVSVRGEARLGVVQRIAR